MLLTLLASVLTWCNVAERLNLGEDEMQLQFDLVQRLITEFNATGRVVAQRCRCSAGTRWCHLIIKNAQPPEERAARAAWCCRRLEPDGRG